MDIPAGHYVTMESQRESSELMTECVSPEDVVHIENLDQDSTARDKKHKNQGL